MAKSHKISEETAINLKNLSLKKILLKGVLQIHKGMINIFENNV